MSRVRQGQVVYKLIRKTRAGVTGKQGGKTHGYHLNVPPEIGDLVPPGTVFVPELVDEGLLFRRVEEEASERPAWAVARKKPAARRRRTRT